MQDTINRAAESIRCIGCAAMFTTSLHANYYHQLATPLMVEHPGMNDTINDLALGQRFY
jgi:hypothetical protein